MILTAPLHVIDPKERANYQNDNHDFKPQRANRDHNRQQHEINQRYPEAELQEKPD